MNRSTLIGSVLAICIFAVARLASASGALSSNPDGCKLVSTASPYYDITYDSTLGGGMFTNSSGGYAWAMCPVAWQDGAHSFMVAGSTTDTSACYLITGSTGGGSTLYYPTSTAGNEVFFSADLTSGTYTAEIQCDIPNGASIYYTSNWF